MHNWESKTFRLAFGLPVALAAAVGMAVSAAVAGVLPHSAAAAPASTGTASPPPVVLPPTVTSAVLAPGLTGFSTGFSTGTGGQDDIAPGRLKAALLERLDMPPGYRTLVTAHILEGNRLVMPEKPGQDRCTQELGPLGPKPTGAPGLTANVILNKSDAGPFMSEFLSSGAPRAARAFVAVIAKRLRECPRVKITLADPGDYLILDQTPLQLPQIGDASVASAFTIRVPGATSVVHGKLFVMAKGRLAGAVVFTGERKELNGFATIVYRAYRKAKRLG
jgi:hypothetical protein